MYTTAPNTGRKIPRRKRCEGAVGFESKRKSVVTQSWPAGWFLSSDIFAIFRARVYTLNIYIFLSYLVRFLSVFLSRFFRTESGQSVDKYRTRAQKPCKNTFLLVWVMSRFRLNTILYTVFLGRRFIHKTTIFGTSAGWALDTIWTNVRNISDRIRTSNGHRQSDLVVP